MVLKIIDSNNIKKLLNKMQNNKTKYRKTNRNNRNNKKTLIVMLNKNNRSNRNNRNNKNKTRKTKCMYHRNNNNRKLNMNKVKFNNRILNIKKLLNNITENTVKKRMTKRVSIANLINNVNTKKQAEMINMNKRNNTLCKSKNFTYKRNMIHKKNHMNNMNNQVTKNFKSSYESHNINGKKSQKGYSVYKNSRYPYGIMRSINNNTLTETLIPN